MTGIIRVERPISAPAGDVWAMVADVTRMGEWSPEATGATWIGGATGPAAGAKFKGTNENGSKSWSTTCTITACEPGRRFAFEVRGGPFKVAEWAYDFTETDGGCTVTETWTDQRGGLVKRLGKVSSGVGDREAHNRASMETTLENLAKAVEA